MTIEQLTQVTPEWLIQKRKDVSECPTWVLVQEPSFVGFGVVRDDRIEWPPGVDPDWYRIQDIRLFGPNGEWHLWQMWDKTWNARLFQKKDGQKYIEENHYLWGTQVERRGDWIYLKEERGVSIPFPSSCEIKDTDLPLRLKVVQIVGYDPKNRLAGIVDAALVGLYTSSLKGAVLPKD